MVVLMSLAAAVVIIIIICLIIINGLSLNIVLAERTDRWPAV